MGDEILQIIKRVGLFMVLAQTILHFRPNESYEKYIKMLIGLMMITMLVLPILNIFRNESLGVFMSYSINYEEKLEQIKQEYMDSTFSVENVQEINMTYQLEEEIKTKVNLLLQEDIYEVKYVSARELQENGNQLGIYILLQEKGNEDSSAIGKVTVGKVTVGAGNTAENDTGTTAMKNAAAVENATTEKIRERIAKAFAMDMAYVEVQIDG